MGGFLWMRVLSHVGKVTGFEKTSGLRKPKKKKKKKTQLQLCGLTPGTSSVVKFTVCFYITNSGELLERKW